MRFPHKRSYLFVITIIPAVLLASLFLFLGVVNLISPDVPERALAENTLVGAMLILTAVVEPPRVYRRPSELSAATSA